MSTLLTTDYIDAHMKPNDTAYREVGQKLSDAILNDAKAEIQRVGPMDRIVLHPTIEVSMHNAICISFTYQDASGNSITVHREV